MDPALSGRGGHHFQWFERIAGELVARGHEVRAYVHHDAEGDTLEAMSRQAPATPLFVSQPYALPAKTDPICGDLSLFMADMQHLPAALRQVAPADLWVWPTLFASHLPALAAANLKVPVAACIHWPPDRQLASGPAIWRYGALTAKAAGTPLRICATVPELGPLYRPLLGRSLPVLPIPIDAGPPPAHAARELETIGFFGRQDGRKGAELLPRLVTRLLKRGFKVVLQDSSKQMRLRGAGHPNLQLLGYVDDLPAAMAACDLVVAPYDPAEYRYMASGIVWEALSRGVPAVAPHGTNPGSLLERLGAGTTFRTYDLDGILAAIDEARARHGGLRQAAVRTLEAWPRHHGVSHHVSALLGLRRPAAGGNAGAPSTVWP